MIKLLSPGLAMLAVIFAGNLCAQGLPGTDIWLVRGVMPLFPANEDFTIDHQGNYWSGNGSKLYKRAPGDRRWELMVDFGTFGMNHISRLAINLKSNQIAFVNDHVVTH